MVSKLIIKWSIKPKLFEVKFLVRNEWESVKKETVKDMQTILKFPVQEITGIELLFLEADPALIASNNSAQYGIEKL